MATSIEELYQEILDGKRKRFPRGTWTEDVDGTFKKRVTRYLIEVILKWGEKDIKEKWEQSVVIKFKLTSVMRHYRSSPYEMLNAAYPSQFEPWELKRVPKGFWTFETSLKILKEIVEEKEKFTDGQLLNVYSLEWLMKNGLGGACSIYFNDSPFQMLNAAYPGRFKEWEIKSVPNNFWTKETAMEALIWWIEEKEKLTKDRLIEVFSGIWLKERKLGSVVRMYWEGNAYKMLDEVYPNQFREWELKKVSHDFWNDEEKSLEILKQIIEEKGMSEDDIRKKLDIRWIKKNHLSTPLRKFWSDSPYKMLNAAYPNQFKEWELKAAPNGFWKKERASRIIKEVISREGISISQLLTFSGKKWMRERKLGTPFNKYWNSSMVAMLKDLYPKEFEIQSSNKKELKFSEKKSHHFQI